MQVGDRPFPEAETQRISIPWFRWKLLGDQAACAHFKAMSDGDDWDEVESQNPAPCGEGENDEDENDAGDDEDSGAGGSGGSGPILPTIAGECPTFMNGTIDFMGLTGIQMQVGAKSEGTGSLIFYWHGTGASAGESYVFGGTSEVLAAGGIIIAPSASGGQGGDCSGTGTFSIGDMDVADQIAACAVRDHGIDPRRIYTTGCEAGGLMAGCMATLRSSYIAAATTNSGGIVSPMQLEGDHVPALMTMHGGSSDMVTVTFSETSARLDNQFKKAGGFVMNCDHGDAVCEASTDLQAAAWRFMKAHRFGVEPEPYTAVPADFPDYCEIY